MSIAKPLLDYAKSLKPKKGFTQSFSTFKKLMNYHKRYSWFVVAIVILSIIRSVLFSVEPLYTTFIIINVIGPPSNMNLLWGYLLAIILAGIGFAISNFVLSFVHGIMSQYIVRDIRTEYYRSLQSKSFSFYDSVAVGDLTSRATVDLQLVDMFLRTWLSTVLNAIFTTIIIIVIILP